MTLKMGSRTPKSNQFFYMSQQSRCAGMVKIHLFLQEIGCRQVIFQFFFPNNLSPRVTLKMRSRSSKSNQHFHPPPHAPNDKYVCLSKIHPSIKERVQTRGYTDRIRTNKRTMMVLYRSPEQTDLHAYC